MGERSSNQQVVPAFFFSEHLSRKLKILIHRKLITRDREGKKIKGGGSGTH